MFSGYASTQAGSWANRESRNYDRTKDEITLSEVERIRL
jgi:hypothetical protein